MSANIRIRFGLQIVLVCLYGTPSHYSHCANLSEGIELIKCLSDIFCRSVWVRLSTFSPLSIMQYVGLYVFSLPISFVMIERIYILCLIIIIKSEVWTITHCLGLGHETMVSAVCLSIFLCNHPTRSYRATRALKDPVVAVVIVTSTVTLHVIYTTLMTSIGGYAFICLSSMIAIQSAATVGA